jgi:hypothetical protein
VVGRLEVSDLEAKVLRAKILLSHGPPWAHYLDGYQDRLLDGPLELPNLSCTTPDDVEHKDFGEGVLG